MKTRNDTEYLLKSEANAKRLFQSIKEMEPDKFIMQTIDSLKGILPHTDKAISLDESDNCPRQRVERLIERSF
ncbi:MAG: hypothetical protein GY750_14690 [Lentisphaerae bacterium]|nr:hypothetical protein [Lentisphaerota bacterium]MCP4102649.1 hypothetical protein [Lentisphaerota bacterium]